jgi:predicted nucleotidyltransferase
MDEISEKINIIVKNYIRDVQKHVLINRAILYGSYVKGNHNEYSDVDVAIFSDSFKGKNRIEVNTFLFSLARKYKEVCIEPVGFDSSDLEEDNPFIKEILNTGKEIYVQ